VGFDRQEVLAVPFVDRREAGRRLARRLEFLRGADPVVLGLPRGGVPVAFEVALALDAPLDVVVVRKLGVPYQPELGMGAIGEEGVRVLNPEVVRGALVTEEELAAVERRERDVLQRRVRALRRGRPPVPLAGRTVVVVDDGIATGSTARAACGLVRARGAARVVLAVPVAPRGVLERLLGPDPAAVGAGADEAVCLETPRYFSAIGRWYADFTQVSDKEVVALLDRAAHRPGAAAPGGPVAEVAPSGDPRERPHDPVGLPPRDENVGYPSVGRRS
jgi:predicted phosphoribosyltransferase